VRIAWAFLRLIRLDSSILGFLTLFVPLWSRTGHFQESARLALPLLFAWICAFVGNDLDDKDRDEINHPQRPIPTGTISPAVAAGIYFTSLAFAMLTTKEYVPGQQAFWYYGVLALFISYHYIVEHIPILKPSYVSGAITAPIVMLTRFFPHEAHLVPIATAAFCFALGRELCMDVLDRLGDTESLLTRVHPRVVAAAAFGIQMVGLIQLVAMSETIRDWLVVAALAVALVIAAHLWFGLQDRRTAIRVMKVQLAMGLILLI
jgi:geranylgeranylglycerol-phosphate geranylgeranyltransferase